ncbi:MAG TPA: hypothetical protein VIN59_06330 [Alphaproteobacteria bacterium]
MFRILLISILLLTTPAWAKDNFKLTPSSGHQAVKASIQNYDPAHFTINLKKAANISVNKKAPTYAIYTKASMPAQCADYRGDDIAYQKPDRFHRVFDFSQRPDVIRALDKYGCVVIYNKPKLPPSKS